ncbi:MAG: pyridoxamine 5'-phosphate oxidase [Ignavibacteria bacterium]|nr:pyridoxamine 5'-phosphate oxidase [Ignavibacteria bacterium]HCN38034.1 pyridoxamine 5'-phosphate oxidase [Bacteroidota bacterium]
MDLKTLRREYKNGSLSENDINKNPFKQFSDWFKQVLNSELLEPTAMVLATCDKDLRPSARVVLLKEFNDKGFIFCTNYLSRKGSDIEKNPKGALLFYWAELERQIRIEGVIEKIERSESEKYFNARPLEARIGAIASKQSSKVSSRDELENSFNELLKKYKTENKEPDTPENWGGYILKPDYFEFWQGRESRLHDRITYRLSDQNIWEIARLYP